MLGPRRRVQVTEPVTGSRLVVVPDVGHLASEPAMICALVGETDRMRG